MSLRRLILIQARRLDDPMRDHEVECFSRHLEVPADALEIFNILEDPGERLDAMMLDERSCFFIGGSGDYCVSQGGPETLQNFIARVVPKLAASGRPLLGSCWGYHALAAGLGGRVERTGESEVGTYSVRRCRDLDDPLFEGVPDEFKAQMGHNDWVVELPGDARPLCENDASPQQAVRFGDGPVYGLQFHAELTHQDNSDRYLYYIENYGGAEAAAQQLDLFEPSPHANTILARFRALYCEEDPSRDDA